ncbi:TPA: MBOAT family protein [Escherichia albertii]|nr:MBOAT family protein [Escherichia albertii]HEB1495827.1 MBOAT family protein [Escherichia albertii]HEB1504760.1 MBOAT family protein [Escherichia albertii]HEB1513986.1 MBOAT family protein [Escherichia albertii]HEB1545630.1 MBOAT family protein [Escherichia albertii]
MAFNSLHYIFIFLPLVAFLNLIVWKIHPLMSRFFITAVSIWFYCELANDGVLWLAISCIITYVSYLIGNMISFRRTAFGAGIIFNASMLCLFKYKYIFTLSELPFRIEDLIAPVAISFFVFQQVSFLVDAYKKKIERVSLLDYVYYITFFPKMVSGPITRYDRLMAGSAAPVDSSKLISGLVLLSIGLYKKIVLSSIFATAANAGYAAEAPLKFVESWMTSLSYTMQIYYDFSGYSDMAIGSALILGISLPANFNSPYKAVNIRDFWSRWHISLSTWLRDYVYIPLGGSRDGYPRTLANLLITFAISGAWHGATINFIMWGVLHGVATGINVTWSKLGFSMPRLAGLIVTFLFINFSWVPFRAESFDKVVSIYRGMLGLNGVDAIRMWPEKFIPESANRFEIYKELTTWGISSVSTVYVLALALAFAFIAKNSNEISCHEINGQVVKYRNVFICSALFAISVICLFGGAGSTNFIYSNF